MQTIILPHKALYPVTGHRIAHFAAYGDAYPARGFRAGCTKNEETGGADLSRPVREPEEISPPEQALVFGEREQRGLPRSAGKPSSIGRRTEDYLLAMVTARRLRPLARRRLMTSLPFFVDIRTRKPWVRFRDVLLG